MIEATEVVLQKTLSQLLAQKHKTEKEIKAVQVALAAIGVKSPNLAARRRRKPMDAAEKRAVSRRMKAYWAKKRAGKAA